MGISNKKGSIMKNKKDLDIANNYQFERLEKDYQREKAICASKEFIRANLPVTNTESSNDFSQGVPVIDIIVAECIVIRTIEGGLTQSFYPEYRIDLTASLEDQIKAIKSDLKRMRLITSGGDVFSIT